MQLETKTPTRDARDGRIRTDGLQFFFDAYNRAATMRLLVCGGLFRRPTLLIVTILVICLDTAPGRAVSLLPLQTQEAATLPSGAGEIVLGGSYFHNPRFPAFTPANALQSQELVTAPQLALQIAAGKWVEIQAFYELVYNDQKDAAGNSLSKFGSGDAQLWTKVRLLSERERIPGFALRFGTKLPDANAHDHLGTDETDFTFEALVSKQLGPVAVHANLGISLLGNPGPPIGAPGSSSSGQDDLFVYAVAVASSPWSLSQAHSLKLRVMGEVVGNAGSRFDNERHAARIGLQLSHGNLTGYLGTSFGLVTGSEDVGVTAGILYNFTLDRLAGWVE